jgi:(S)-sulfolactate dehydrogenase
MADVVVTEFMDLRPLDRLKARYSVQVETGLWNQPAALEAAVAQAKALIVRNRTQVTAALIAKAPRLQVVGRLGVGLDNIDLPACQARGIAVCPAVGANALSVAEYVVGAALVLGRSAAFFGSAALTAGGWPREAAGAGWEIAGKRLGLVGFGSIGQTVAGRAAAMGMTVAACDDYVPAASPAWHGVDRLPLDDLLARSDVVSLHCPLTPETRNLLDAGRIARMKPGAVLINAARGGVVDETALAAALRAGHLGGAAIDVFEQEPIDAATAALFSGVPNLILTPHVAGVTREANDRISSLTVDNVLKVLEAAR